MNDRHTPWHRLGARMLIAALITANVILVVITIYGFFVSDAGYDWAIYREAGARVGSPALYEWGEVYAWSYSPLLAYLFAALAPIGYLGWSIFHFGALALLRNLRMALLVLASWPFWADVYNGNTMSFVFVAAYWTLRGNPVGTFSFLTLAVLMPRPVMLPVLAWVLWKRPEWRLRFAGMVVVSAALVVATGYASDWVEVLIGVTNAVEASSRDLGPARIIGLWWVVIGLPLAVVLIARQRLGLASMAASPYWLPQYFLMLLLELASAREKDADGSADDATEPSMTESEPKQAKGHGSDIRQ